MPLEKNDRSPSFLTKDSCFVYTRSINGKLQFVSIIIRKKEV